jgi:hypothetical protein
VRWTHFTTAASAADESSLSRMLLKDRPIDGIETESNRFLSFCDT